MILLLRKYQRNFKFSTAQLVAGRQLTVRPTSRYIRPSENTPRSEMTKSTNRFADLRSPLRSLSSQDVQYHDFNAVFLDILPDLREIVSGYNQTETSTWITKALEYNLRNSETNLFLLTVLTYENLVKTTNVKSENTRLAGVVGWCIETLNTACLMLDDIMDNSSHRRAQPCWHTLDNVGLSCGLNDAVLIINSAYAILKKNLRHLDCYPALLELLHEATFIAACGQSSDMTYATSHVTSFNRESYNNMALHKATYDNFYLPFAAAAQLAGFTDEEALRQSKDIILEIGLFFQIQNDFLDCFGTLQTGGKIGTDIQDHKYSWLAIACMEQASDEQKQIMIECYGKNDPEKVQRVKQLYKDLDLPGVYAAYEDESYNNTKALIKNTSNGVPHEIFLQILNRIYRRNS